MAIEIENRGRRVWHFPVLSLEETEDGRKLLRETGMVTIGDSADRVLDPRLKERDPARTPDPAVKITAEEWEGIGPDSRRIIRKLIETGEFSGSVPREK